MNKREFSGVASHRKDCKQVREKVKGKEGPVYLSHPNPKLRGCLVGAFRVVWNGCDTIPMFG